MSIFEGDSKNYNSLVAAVLDFKMAALQLIFLNAVYCDRYKRNFKGYSAIYWP